jgi:hypothetical protein
MHLQRTLDDFNRTVDARAKTAWIGEENFGIVHGDLFSGFCFSQERKRENRNMKLVYPRPLSTKNI